MRNNRKVILVFFIFVLLGCVQYNFTQSDSLTSTRVISSLKTSSVKDAERLFDDIKVNNYTENAQESPSICALSSDTIVVTWQSSGQYGPDMNVYAKILNATTGNATIPDFLVNLYTVDNQFDPQVCALSSEVFVIVWVSADQDGSGLGIYAKVFNATTGGIITEEFLINTYTLNSQSSPSICGLSSDTFAVAWVSSGQDGSGYGIYEKVFNATTGSPLTLEFRANTFIANDQSNPSICALSNDIFAVVWSSYGQENSAFGVYARIFNGTTGIFMTPEFRVNSDIEGGGTGPSVCALSSDIIVVVWYRISVDDVYGIVLNATTGNEIKEEFKVNTYTANKQDNPYICTLSSDAFIVAWASYGQDGSENGIYSMVYNLTTEKKITNEFQVNTYTLNSQWDPSISALSSNSFSVVWCSYGQDGSSFGIYFSSFRLIPSSATTVGGVPGFNILILIGIVGLSLVILTRKVIRIRK